MVPARRVSARGASSAWRAPTSPEAPWFDDTSGGQARQGQIFRLIPSGDPSGGGVDKLELHLEAERQKQLDSPDTLVVTPWNDVWLAEDGYGAQRIMGITPDERTCIRPDGRTYSIERKRLIGRDEEASSEWAGPCFSPDGRTFFVNVQAPGHTVAITGPFPHLNARRVRQAPCRLHSTTGHRRSRASWRSRRSRKACRRTRRPFDRLGVELA